ncbi:MAG: gamma-glutamyltransferase, partial [Pseudomonadota bacterium]|nr:gamma-glutamyltransferase [Pseudomonadota bacterium]
AVSGGDIETVRAAEIVLEAGGNAFDAVLAAMCASCIAEPVLGTLGGGGFLLARPEGEKPRLYDFFCQTPKHMPPGKEVDLRRITVDFGGALQDFITGAATIATPGILRGLFDIHRDLGSVPIRVVLEPAISLARDGLTLEAMQAHFLKVIWPIWGTSADIVRLFADPNDPTRPLGAGDRLTLPEMADALDALAHEGDDLFYRGEMGRALVEKTQNAGGLLTRDDLADYRTIIRAPLSIRFGDATIHTNPPPSSGGILAAFSFAMLDKRIGRTDFGGQDHLSQLVLAMALTDRARSEAAASQLSMHDLIERYRSEVAGLPTMTRGTTHMNVIDRHGNAAALTHTNGEGCGLVVPGTGIVVNNMMGEEDLNRHPYGKWPVDTRLSSMMMPSLVTWDDGREAVLGSGGSKRIRTSVMQVMLNLIAFGLSPIDAVGAPRLYIDDTDGMLHVEAPLTEAALDFARQHVRTVNMWDRKDLYFGGVHVSALDPRTNALTGAGDPRRGGVARIAGNKA